jgi:hypothetical protein
MAGSWISEPSFSLKSQRRSSTRTSASRRSRRRGREDGRQDGAGGLVGALPHHQRQLREARGVGLADDPAFAVDHPHAPVLPDGQAGRSSTAMNTVSGSMRTTLASLTQPTPSTRGARRPGPGPGSAGPGRGPRRSDVGLAPSARRPRMCTVFSLKPGRSELVVDAAHHGHAEALGPMAGRQHGDKTETKAAPATVRATVGDTPTPLAACNFAAGCAPLGAGLPFRTCGRFGPGAPRLRRSPPHYSGHKRPPRSIDTN